MKLALKKLKKNPLKPRNFLAKELLEDRKYEHKVAVLKKFKKSRLTSKDISEAWDMAHEQD